MVTPSAVVSANDEELLRTLGSGEPEAVALLYQRYGAKMLAFARRYVADEATAEDVVVELLRRWLEHPPNVREFERLASFLATSVYHAAVDWIRRDRAQQGHAPRSERPAPVHDRRERPSVVEANEARPEALGTRLAGALQQLADQDRLLLETHYGQALTTDECMALLGISRDAFHQRLHRARTRLARLLATDLNSSGKENRRG